MKMNKNSLKKLKSFIKNETTHPKQIVPGNARLSLGLYRTPEEETKYKEQKEKEIKKYSKKQEKEYRKYLKKNNIKNI
jgi:hypothetical protein